MVKFLLLKNVALICCLMFYLIIPETFVFASVYDSYCKITCGKLAKHTACKRAGDRCGPVQNCNSRNILLTDKIRQAIVDKHNSLRSKVAVGSEKTGPQPYAANMNVLNYNFELEFIAQCLANTCTFAHDECRDTKKLIIGQNIAEYCQPSEAGLYSEEVLLQAIQNWYDEVKDVKTSQIDSYSFKNSSAHYTQMIWGDIEALGCGRGLFKEESGNWCVLLICNYGGKHSGGNRNKFAVYKVGAPCTLCPKTKKCNTATGLCGKAIPVKNIPRFNHAANVDTNLKVFSLILFSLIINRCLM